MNKATAGALVVGGTSNGLSIARSLRGRARECRLGGCHPPNVRPGQFFPLHSPDFAMAGGAMMESQVDIYWRSPAHNNSRPVGAVSTAMNLPHGSHGFIRGLSRRVPRFSPNLECFALGV